MELEVNERSQLRVITTEKQLGDRSLSVHGQETLVVFQAVPGVTQLGVTFLEGTSHALGRARHVQASDHSGNVWLSHVSPPGWWFSCLL